MTQPVGSNSSPNYTPYDPEEAICQSDGTAAPNGGPEGTGGTPSAPPPAKENPDCIGETMSAVSTCGGAYLASKLSPTAGLFALIGCAVAVDNLVECLNPESKAQGQ